MDINDIKKVIEQNNYLIYGLRCDHRIINSGEVFPASHEWLFDDPCDKPCIVGQDEYGDDIIEYQPRTTNDETYSSFMKCWDMGELDGTCAIEIDINDIDSSINLIKQYFDKDYKYFYLIAGDDYSGGNDYQEIIIHDAVCIDRLNIF